MGSRTGRIQIEVVQIRAQDIEPGDVVRRGSGNDSWFEVARVSQLPGGDLLVADEADRMSFTVAPLNLVALQIARPLRANSHLPLPDVEQYALEPPR